MTYKTGVFKIHGDVELPEWEIIDDSYEAETMENDDQPPSPAVNA